MGKFQVVRCYSEKCNKYQVQQAKKVKKWKCKVCNESQSLKRIYFQSDYGKDCREAVQQLNTQKTVQLESSFQSAGSHLSSKRFSPFEPKVKNTPIPSNSQTSLDYELDQCLDLFDLPTKKESSQDQSSNIRSQSENNEEDFFKDSKWNQFLDN